MFKRIRKLLMAVAALAALAVGGSAIAGAATSKGAAAKASSPPPAHGTAAHEDAEQAVTGDAAAKAQAAAVAAVGSGSTAGAVTTDFPGTGYEVTVTKADGSKVEIHLDSSFAVLQGRGPGGPAHGTAAHENAETAVTGDAAAKAQAAAVASVGSGSTAGAVTTDFRGDGYEVTVTKSDGTKVEVHLDGSFTVLQFPGPGHDGPPPSGSGA